MVDISAAAPRTRLKERFAAMTPAALRTLLHLANTSDPKDRRKARKLLATQSPERLRQLATDPGFSAADKKLLAETAARVASGEF